MDVSLDSGELEIPQFAAAGRIEFLVGRCNIQLRFGLEILNSTGAWHQGVWLGAAWHDSRHPGGSILYHFPSPSDMVSP